ncbi:MAG: reverse transcriptase domain-containing protein [Crocosphaera sp.]|nr:reverse transcriptase domain-containing protein [Crocosphaera sp.]
MFLPTDMGTTSLDLPQEELKRQFEQLKTRQDVAKLLQVSDYQLRYHLYIYPRDKAYTTFKIPKKSGGHRLITTPQTSLKIIQHKLNQVLSSVYKVKPSVHGFAIQKSIVTNAKRHLKQRYILNLEDQDFFPSINFGRVRGLFIAQPYNCTKEVATILAQICCYNNQLPQGAPTSPIISNMICARLDSQLQKLAKKYRCIYTRYADDITFSTSRFKFPHRLAYFSQDSETFVLADELITIIKDNGFSVNLSKLRLQNRYQRQGVYSFAIPIPKHRQDVKEICIEHYYQDSEIKRTDKNNRRLFLSDEFHSKSGKHLSNPQLNTTEINKFKSNQLKIIDDKVFDSESNNVALPKDDFATYIYDKEEGFNDFDFTAFKEVFEIIKKILNRHYS